MDADDRYGTIPRMAVASAARFGDAEAIVDGDERLTFAGVADGMRKVAVALVASGIGVGDRVALWAPNSANWVRIALGVQAAGAVLVPLNTRLTADEAAYILTKSGSRALFAVEEFLGRRFLDALRRERPDLAVLRRAVETPGPGRPAPQGWLEFLDSGGPGDAAVVDRRMSAATAADASDIIFTSGTTGFPKGAILRHGASLKGYERYNTGPQIDDRDRPLIVLPFFHTFGYKAGWMLNLMVGATTVSLPTFDPEQAMQTIEREQVTYLPGSPTMFVAMLDHPARAGRDLRSLRGAVVSASTVPVELVRRLTDEMGLTCITGYGLTECHGLVSVSQPGDDPDVIASTVGRPLPGLEVRVVDGSGADVAPGQPGELLVHGYTVMSGYFDDPDLTADAVRDGWLHTGDVVVADTEGYLRITDRKKDIYIVGGFNVAPAEVERALAGLEQISQVAVIGVPDPTMGEVGVAFVVPRPGAALSPEEVLHYAVRHMANYKVPRRVEIVRELPLNATGKVLKTRLRELAESRHRSQSSGPGT
ncbi:AMP-binding protein [Acidiferrimicrobium sp. IK]|uniref:AMP-binding protein n=1 Tax=Acidiferrimicrobium sp. IK TaxID=2871700 RepID=UPI0021CB0FDF|nr:AMP-binding protein [Acidiferrimicrobium sp. IK]MCU4186805.1 AMP-binding protein [Acidiferrimicrobium sp. IK]